MKTNKLIGVIVALLISINCGAQTIHVLGFANTLDQRIGQTCEVDMARIQNEIAEIGMNINYEVSFDNIYTGEDCSKENLLNSIERLKCKSNDIIFFYYTGHGVRSSQDSDPFPQLCLKYKTENNFVALHTIVSSLEKKNAQFTLVLTDCCNSISTAVSPKSASIINSKGMTYRSDNASENYKTLFSKQKGTLVATSSKIGQVSGCDPFNGGWFTFSFFENIAQAVNGNITNSWETILSQAGNMTNEISLNSPNHNPQNPYYNLPGNALVPAPSTQNIQVVSVDNELEELIKPIINLEYSTEYRLSKAKDALKSCFASNSKVSTVARNGSTIIDYEDAEAFLRRLSMSRRISQICILKVERDANGKITNLKVREIRNKQ